MRSGGIQPRSTVVRIESLETTQRIFEDISDVILVCHTDERCEDAEWNGDELVSAVIVARVATFDEIR